MQIMSFNSSDYVRIVAIVRSAITFVFKEQNFFYDEYEDVEEVVSLAFEKILRNWHKYDECISKSSWFSTIAKRCACTYVEKQTQWKFYHPSINVTTMDGEFCEFEYANHKSPDSYHADAELISKERMSIINREINSLGERTKQAMLFISQGYTPSEIQEYLGIENGAFRTMLSRGRRQLAQSKEVRAMCTEVLGRDLKIPA